MYKLKAHCQEAAAVLPILLKLFLNSFGQEEVVSREQEEAEEEVVSFSGDTCLFAHRCPSPFFAWARQQWWHIVAMWQCGNVACYCGIVACWFSGTVSCWYEHHPSSSPTQGVCPVATSNSRHRHALCDLSRCCLRAKSPPHFEQEIFCLLRKNFPDLSPALHLSPSYHLCSYVYIGNGKSRCVVKFATRWLSSCWAELSKDLSHLFDIGNSQQLT